ncbi:GGDEF/EAL domain-containing response regulator [Beggiatoa leptomitoformis]|uniref:EAL domain-containing protein n=1 Tax=Beggiatoa leptomitoformis TaxID=288004 RepID=A0A2N9YFX4_9GAMM|nr:EAL domain-containing protein [Beggiatoa leptomitoformis]ALG68300.1 EAL domain-containing protein [Beggiatoa leptomitoformis]AUI69387.1 EAL domain-containing protein [Beggiatoa leptomitoformis]
MIPIDIIRLIVVEESANDAEMILNSLRKARFPIRPRHVEDDEDLQNALTEQEWDLLISVPQVGDFTVAQACEMVASSRQDIPIIVLMEKLEGQAMGALLSAGARHVIPRDNENCLQIIVGRELQELASRRQHKHLDQLYRESQRQNSILLETSRDAIAYVHDGMHVHANPSYLEMFGYKSMEVLEGLPVMDLVSLEDQSKFKDFMRDFMTHEAEGDRNIQLRGIRADRKAFKVEMEVSQAIYSSERCIQVIVRDQSQDEEKEKLQRQLKEANIRDHVTGLYNRTHFIALLEKALAKAMESTVRSTVLYITLDNVSVGSIDLVIKNIGKVIGGLTETGVLARFGDNIFTILMIDKDITYASELAGKLCKAVEATVTDLGIGESIITTCSIGIALVLASAATPQNVLSDAHAACLEAHKRGGNTFEVYKAVIKTPEQGGLKNSDIAKMIETAIEESRLSLRYQPIVSLHGESQEIYEVFLRMVDSEGKPIPSGSLFSAAEQANLSIKLDKWVLQESFKVLMKQEKSGHQTFFFIKLADQAIKDENIPLFIRKLLKATGLPGERLIFEINETIAISQVNLAKAFISTLNKMGCKTALEHFGTGLNSATTLKHIPVDYVKIHYSYAKGLSTNTENQKAVQDIVKLAHEQGKITIAEAVEDANSLTVLWQCEVDFAQGHYVQEPSDDLSYEFTEEE